MQDGRVGAIFRDVHIAASMRFAHLETVSQEEREPALPNTAEEDRSTVSSSSRRSSRHSSRLSCSGLSELTVSALTPVDECSVDIGSGPSTRAMLPPPPQALEPVYEPETPLARRPPRRPLPTLPTGPRFTPLHSLPALPSSRLVVPISDESAAAAEEKRAYARARGLDELFEATSLSSSETTAAGAPLNHAVENGGTSSSALPDYAPGSGAAGLARIRSMVKRDQRLGDVQDAGEGGAARDAARERAAKQALRQLELDARDSKAQIARRVEEEERQRRGRALAETDSRSRKERDADAIDEIDGLDDPPPPHEETVASTSGCDMLPLSDSKAHWPLEPPEPQRAPSSVTPAPSRLPPPPLPAPADYFSIARDASSAPTNAAGPVDTPYCSSSPFVDAYTLVPRLTSFRRGSSLYSSGIDAFPADNLLHSPHVGLQSTSAGLPKQQPARKVSLGPPTSFYSTNVGLAVSLGR